ncbi:FCS-Like Zinc finger 17-like [Rhodamnia argentea]|uniref:FCS-Like Zinc finger 17-like n=1 Tax=Rhodamnia argentea TaxID=178133 RepID=A0A8B8NNF8_9MYRT|nr:FCS-Like Zinc finger 17-like [Rhodamnia argentea]
MPEQRIKEIRERNSKNNRPPSSSSPPSLSSAAVGLRILTQVPETTKPHIVVQSRVTASLRRHVKSRSQARSQSGSDLEYSCFLQTCSLCHKKLSPDHDIYMYRGDEGYCSVECRGRRIVMDEMKEREASAKRMVSSPRHCYAASLQSETRLLREELRRRQGHLIPPKTRTMVPAIWG